MRFKLFYEQDTPQNIDFYHSTQKNIVPFIIDNGFKISTKGKHKYGRGVYGTTDLESQKSDLQSGNYGDTIIHAYIPDEKFIHFYKGSAPDQQFEQYFDSDKYPEVLKILQTSNSPVFTAQMFAAVQQKYPEIWDTLNGVTVQDKGTNIIAVYKPEKLILDSIGYDSGEQWEKIKGEN